MAHHHLSTQIACFILLFFFSTACTSTRVTVMPSDSDASLRDFKTYDFFQVEASGDTTDEFHQSLAQVKKSIKDMFAKMEESGRE